MLEPRVMLDGAAVIDGIETLTQGSPTLLSELGLTATRESGEQTNSPESDALYLAPTSSMQSDRRNELVFIDSRVDLSSVEEIAADRTFVISNDVDAFAYMAEITGSFEQVDAIHVISHGADGELLLGNETYTSSNLETYRTDLAALGSGLTGSGDILVYACDLAATDDGREFIQKLSLITKADISASDDATGQDGDYVLEVSNGDVEADDLLLDGSLKESLFAEVFTTVDISGNTLETVVGFENVGYPVETDGIGNTGTGIPFNTYGSNSDPSVMGYVMSPANGDAVSVSVPSLTGQNTMYALLTNTFGDAGVNEYTITVNFSDSSSVSFDSIGGSDTRDFNYNTGTSGTVNGTTTTAWWTNYADTVVGGFQRLDVRQFDLSSYSDKTITSASIVSVVDGSDSQEQAMLSGLTFSTGSPRNFTSIDVDGQTIVSNPNVFYWEGGSATDLLSSYTFATAGTYADGYVQFSISSNGDSNDLLSIASTDSATGSGVISQDGDGFVYIGNGTTKDLLGSVDSVLDGAAGKALKINFSAALPNAGFEDVVSGVPVDWNLSDQFYGTGYSGNGETTTGELDLFGIAITEANEPTISGSPYNGNETFTSTFQTVNYTETDANLPVADSSASIDSSGGVGGSNALKLESAWFISSGYGSIHGPYATSSSFSVSEGDSLSLDFKALKTADDYEVYGLLRKVDSNGDFVDTSSLGTAVTDDNIILFAQRGSDTDEFITVSKTGLKEGSYKFQFIGGSYDRTGGRGIGSELYVDNIRLISSSGVAASDIQAIARAVQYSSSDSSQVSPGNTIEKTVAVSVVDGGATTQDTSSVKVVLQDPPQPTISASSSVTRPYSKGSGLPIDLVDSISVSNVASVSVTVSANLEAGDILELSEDSSTMGDITSSFDATNGILTLTSASGATASEWSAAIDAVRYYNESASQGLGARTILFTVIAIDGDTATTSVQFDITESITAPTDPSILNPDSVVPLQLKTADGLSNFMITQPYGVSSDGAYYYMNDNGTKLHVFNMEGIHVRTIEATSEIDLNLPGGQHTLTYTEGYLYYRNGTSLYARPVDNLETEIAVSLTSGTLPTREGYNVSNVLGMTDGRLAILGNNEEISAGVYEAEVSFYTVSDDRTEITFDTSLTLQESDNWLEYFHGIETDGDYLFITHWVGGVRDDSALSDVGGYRSYSLTTGARVFDGQESTFSPSWDMRDVGDLTFMNPTYLGRNPLTGSFFYADFSTYKNVLAVSKTTSISAVEDVSTALSTTDFATLFSGTLADVKITRLPVHGTLSLDTTGDGVGDSSILVDQVLDTNDQAKVIYTPAAEYSGADSFLWVGRSSGGSWSSEKASIITVGNVDDAPEIAITAANPYAIELNGTSDYLSADTPLLNDLSTFTLSFWMNPNDATTSAEQSLFGQNDTFEIFLESDTAVPTLVFWNTTSGDLSMPLTGVSNNQWVHIGVRGDSVAGTVEVFVNGTLAGTASHSSALSYEPYNDAARSINTTVGGYVLASDPRYLQGQLDEISVWNVSLTDDEMAGLVDLKLDGGESGLLAYWSMDEGSGSTVNNLVSGAASNTDLSLNGSPQWIASTLDVIPTYKVGEDAAIVAAPSVVVNDVDSAINVTVAITSNFASGDVLQFTNDSSSMGNIGASYDSATGILTLESPDGSASMLEWKNALSAILFSTRAIPSSADRTITWSVTDGVNDASAVSSIGVVFGGYPDLSDTGSTANRVRENGSIAITSSDFETGFPFTASADRPSDTFDSIRVTSLPVNGALSFGGVPVSLNQEISLPAIDSGRLIYTPDTDYLGSETFKLKAIDSSGYPSDEVSFSISVYEEVPFSLGTVATGFTEGDDPVVLFPNLVLGNALGEAGTKLSGMQLFIDNVQSGDTLSAADSDSIAVSYNSAAGRLSLKGDATIEEYQALLRTVTFSNASSSMSEVARSIAIQAQELVSLNFGGKSHYYEYVSGSLAWDAAVTAAASRTIVDQGGNTLTGYLVTVTSAEENAFINSKLAGNAWMGASDATTEGVWQWVTGPEAGMQFWEGDLNAGNSITSNYGAAVVDTYDLDNDGDTTELTYGGWASGEPNNWGTGEDVAHFYAGTGTWNDFPNSASVSGYVVEYNSVTEYTPVGGTFELAVSRNAAPTISITAPAGDGEFNVGTDSTVSLASAVSVADTDSDIDSAYVKVKTNYSSSSDSLSFTNDGATMGDITGTFHSGTGILSLSSAIGATDAEWNAALASITFTSTDVTYPAGDRTIVWGVSDGRRETTTNTTVDMVYNAPLVSANGTEKYYIESGSTHTFSIADFTNEFTYSSDVYNWASIKINTLPTGGYLTLNGSSVSVGDTIDSASLSGLVYTVRSSFTGTDTFGWSAVDTNGAPSNSVNFTFELNNAGAPDLSAIADDTYVEQASPIELAASNFASHIWDGLFNVSGQAGYIDFEITANGDVDANSTGDVFSVVATSADPDNPAHGDVRLNGRFVEYYDTQPAEGASAAWIQVGQIDSTYDGEGGTKLRINLLTDASIPGSSPVTNGDFSDVLTNGWTSYTSRVDFGSRFSITDGGGSTVSIETPYDLDDTSAPAGAPVMASAPRIQQNDDSTISRGPSGASVSITGSDNQLYLATGSMTIESYGVVHGPAVVSDVFPASAGDILKLDYTATGAGDDYHVAGYLVDSSGDIYKMVLNDTGRSASDTASVTIDDDGNYRFVFITGTFDASGGRAAGAAMSIDNIRAEDPYPINDWVVESIIRAVQYSNDSDDPDTNTKAMTLSVAQDSTSATSYLVASNIDVTAVMDAPTLSANAALAAVNEDTLSPTGATVTSLFSSKFADGDNDSFVGIAISGDASTANEGRWQYSFDGTAWNNLGAVSTSSALLLDTSAKLRFVPSLQYHGAPGQLTAYSVDDGVSQTFSSASTLAYVDTTADTLESHVSAAGKNLTTSITSVEDMPEVVASPEPSSKIVGTEYLYDFSTSFFDGDGDVLTYAISVEPPDLTFDIASGLTFDTATGILEGRLDELGSYTITVTATDPQNNSENVTLELDVYEPSSQP
ncbi:DUF4347 domain-containing protein, partial [Litoricolaceae bacterium]|nr:DUF4347 domain-containing protein [Litorivicinaceae bacterium]